MNEEALVQKLTFTQKAMLLTGNYDIEGRDESRAIPELGIEKLRYIDGPAGIRQSDPDHGGTVAMPAGTALGATWNPEVLYEAGHHLAKAARHYDCEVALGPIVDIQRQPLSGRVVETLSEDPLMAGKLGAAFVRGIQDNGVGCALKHFAVYGQEDYRRSLNVEVDERPLREIYLRPFEICLSEAHPTGLMCAYNKMNGQYASENRYLLNEILRKEWGYDGMVISDWGAVHNVSKAVHTGVSLTMPAMPDIEVALKDGLEKGLCTMEDIDFCCAHVIKMVQDVKALCCKDTTPYVREEEHKAAQELAKESIVLLKNTDNVLPIKPNQYRKIAVIGWCGHEPVATATCTSGCALPNRESVDSPVDFIRQYAGEQTEVIYDAMPYNQSGSLDKDQRGRILDLAGSVDLVIYFLCVPEDMECEGEDRRDLRLPYFQTRVAAEVALINKNCVFVQQSGGALGDSFGRVNPFSGDPKALIQMWISGEGGGKAVADVLFGKENPSGKLPITFMNELNPYTGICSDPVRVTCAERLEVGYRYYDRHPEKVWYPFGFGLSYTTFAYDHLTVSPDHGTSPDQTVTVTFTVTNTGKVAGKEAVQLYVAPEASSVDRPIKELKGFDKIALEPGETKTVTMTLDKRSFAYYNTNEHDWHVESGVYNILVGASSQDIRLKGAYEVNWDGDYSVERRYWTDDVTVRTTFDKH